MKPRRQAASPPSPAPFASRQLARSWEETWRRHRRVLRQCRRHPSGKNVHDLRIATRRLLAHLTLLHPAASRPGLKRARRRLKRLMRTTAPARDAQVQILLLERLAGKGGHPGLEKFRHHLARRMRRFTADLVGQLKRHRAKPPRLRMEKWPPGPVAAVADRMLRRAFDRMQTRLRTARSADPAAHHRARVAVKKFRYLAEAARGGAMPAGRLHAIQSTLGEMHDLDLFLHRLEKFAARHPQTEAWLQPQRPALHRRRQALVRHRPRLPARLDLFLEPARGAHRKAAP